jgi:hypothetical protein
MKKLLQFILLTLAFLVAGVAAATTLADPAGAATATPIAAAQPAGCQPVLDLGKLAPTQGETCPATAAPQTTTPEPEFLIGTRTCRCSCGYPCKTDADCGPGGICSAGITCC